MTARIIALTLLSLVACGDAKGGPGETGTSTSSATGSAGVQASGGAEPCSTGTILDGTTGETYDDVATFSVSFSELIENQMVCNIETEETTYALLAWSVNVLTPEDVYPGPMTSGTRHFVGDSYNCGDVAPVALEVDIHSPGWYAVGLVEHRQEAVNEGWATAEYFYCYYNDLWATYAFEVTEDDYNDVTVLEIEGSPSWSESSCVTRCRQPGQGCE
jgi:hypothetical protein